MSIRLGNNPLVNPYALGDPDHVIAGTITNEFTFYTKKYRQCVYPLLWQKCFSESYEFEDRNTLDEIHYTPNDVKILFI